MRSVGKSRTSETAISAANFNVLDSQQIIGNKVKRSQSVDFTSVDNFRDKCNKYAGPSAFNDLSVSLLFVLCCVTAILFIMVGIAHF